MKIKYLLPIFVFLFLISFNSSFAWWNHTFEYRAKYNISIDTDQTNYTLRLANIPYNSSMDGLLRDIRFTWLNETSGNEQEIAFWIEENTTTWTNNFTAWLKVPFLNSSINNTIYMYFGNTSAVSSASDGENTFTLFDDFEDGSLDTSKWDSVLLGSGCSVSEGGGVLTLSGTSGNTCSANVKTDSTSYNSNFTVIGIVKQTTTSNTPNYLIYGTGNGTLKGVGSGGTSAYYMTWPDWGYLNNIRDGLNRDDLCAPKNYVENSIASNGAMTTGFNSNKIVTLTINENGTLYVSTRKLTDFSEYYSLEATNTDSHSINKYIYLSQGHYSGHSYDYSSKWEWVAVYKDNLIPSSSTFSNFDEAPPSDKYYDVIENTYNSSVFEYTNQTFILKVNTTSNVSLINASLYWNNTNFYYDSYSNDSLIYTFNKTILIPIVAYEGDYNFYWNITVNYTNGTIIYDTTSASGIQEVNYSYKITSPKIYYALTNNELDTKTTPDRYQTIEGKYLTLSYYIINETNNIYPENKSIKIWNLSSWTSASGTNIYNLSPTCSRVNSTYELCTINKSLLGPYLNVTSYMSLGDIPRNSTSRLEVLNLDPLSCSTGFKVYDIKFYDEQDRTAINQNGSLTFNVLWEENYTMLKYLNCTFDNVNTVSVYTKSGSSASDINFTSSLYLEYYNYEYEKRNYYERDYTTRENSGEVKNIYNIKDTEGDGVLIRVKDQEGNGISQAQVIIKRWYPSTSSYNQVVSVQTDENGEVYTYLEWYTAYYKFQILINGTEVYESEVGTQITESPKEINIILNPQVPYTTWKSSVSYSVEWVGDILRISIYDSSNSFQKAYLNASRYTLTGWVSVCNSSGDSPSTTLLCDLSDETGQVNILSYLQYSNGQYIIYKELKQFGSAIAQETRNEGTFYSLIFIILLSIIGYIFADISGMLIIPVLGIIGLNLLGVISITTSAIIGLFVAIMFAIVAIYKR